MTKANEMAAEAVKRALNPELVTIAPEYTEEALALKYVDRNAGFMRFVPQWGKWFIFDGKVWAEDKKLTAFNLSREVCREASLEYERVMGSNITSSQARKLASAQTVAAVERLAKSDARIIATPEQFDADIWMLNTPDGIYDLRTGIKRINTPQDYCTKITTVPAGGDCPQWKVFLNTVTAGDTGLQNFLQRLVGYGLTGSTREQIIAFFYGTGGNGKGVFINTLQGLTGDYATSAQMDVLTASHGERHPTELAMLRGARIVTAQETEEGRRWAESKVKALTGGDPITARFMRQDFFTFQPQFKLLVAGNHKPGLRNVDEAMRRRFLLVPFTVTIPEHLKDKDLQDKLRAEWSGILQWAIDGARLWYESGLMVPDAVRNATGEYFIAEDTIERWLSERCSFNPASFTTSLDLFNSFRIWCELSGEFAGTQKRLSENLRTKRPDLIAGHCPITRRAGFHGIAIVTQTIGGFNV